MKPEGTSSTIGNDGRISCQPPGNPKCNAKTWDTYSNACCSEQEKCGVGEGDCNSDSECLGSLVCKYNGCPANQGFHKRASCCEQPSGTYKMGRK